jgi:hypothetical protein
MAFSQITTLPPSGRLGDRPGAQTALSPSPAGYCVLSLGARG